MRYMFKLLKCWNTSSCAAATAKSLQSCPTLCDPRDGSPPGSPVPGILQARTLEWGATAFSGSCGTGASKCGGFSCCGSRALERRLSSWGAWLSCPVARGTLQDQGLNPGILHCRQILLLSEPPGGYAAAAAKSLQLCPTLCDPRDGSPPGSPVPGILQARTLEWVAISFSNA